MPEMEETVELRQVQLSRELEVLLVLEQLVLPVQSHMSAVLSVRTSEHSLRCMLSEM
jgi:hypothetical protein